MKVLFHHEYFDADVSSGTLHAAYQWMELFLACGVTGAAVITFEEAWPDCNSDMPLEVYANVDEFIAAHPNDSVIGTSPDAESSYRDHDYSGADWIYFGGTFVTDLPCVGCVSIPTIGGRELYPREAASVVLVEALLR